MLPQPTPAATSATFARDTRSRRVARIAGCVLLVAAIVLLADAAWMRVRAAAGAGPALAKGLATLAVVPAVAYVLRVARALHTPELRHER
jgi:hypothetical protein